MDPDANRAAPPCPSSVDGWFHADRGTGYDDGKGACSAGRMTDRSTGDDTVDDGADDCAEKSPRRPDGDEQCDSM